VSWCSGNLNTVDAAHFEYLSRYLCSDKYLLRYFSLFLSKLIWDEDNQGFVICCLVGHGICYCRPHISLHCCKQLVGHIASC
jgi:hypothetical protein